MSIYALRTTLADVYSRWWEERHPSLTFKITDSLDGKMIVRVSSSTKSEQIVCDQDFVQDALLGRLNFEERMRELDARVFEAARKLENKAAPAQEIQVIARTFRDYSAAEA